MGLFSLFDSESTTQQTTTTQNVGFNEVSGPALALQGSDNVVTFSDQGALRVAGDIAREAFDQVEVAGANALTGITQAVGAVSASQRAESENLFENIKTVAIIGLLVWGAIAVAKGFR